MLWNQTNTDPCITAPDPTPCKPLLSQHEARFYACAEKLSRGLCRIAIKPRLQDFLRPGGPEGWMTFEEAGLKHIDFLLCRQEDWFPMLAVEVYDSGLESVHLHGRDIIATSLCKAVGIPLIRVEVQDLDCSDALLKKLADGWTTREQYLKADRESRLLAISEVESLLPPVPEMMTRTPLLPPSSPVEFDFEPLIEIEESPSPLSLNPLEDLVVTIPA